MSWEFLECLPLLVCCSEILVWGDGCVTDYVGSYDGYLVLGGSQDDGVPSSVGVIIMSCCGLVRYGVGCDGCGASWFVFFSHGTWVSDVVIKALGSFMLLRVRRRMWLKVDLFCQCMFVSERPHISMLWSHM